VFEEEIRNKMADISQVNIEKMIREYGEKKVVRLMNMMMENNVTMLKLQKQILELQVVAEEKKRRQGDRKQRRREYEERREGDEQRRRKEKEEEEERKRVDESKRRKKSRKRVEMAKNVGKKKR